MEHASLSCWKCGAALDEEPLPLARLAECAACGADLHVCRMCEFYDPSVADACREPVADRVVDKGRANFCGYFRPSAAAHAGGGSIEARAACASLSALFGVEGAAAERSEEDRSREALDELFGLNDPKK